MRSGSSSIPPGACCSSPTSKSRLRASTWDKERVVLTSGVCCASSTTIISASCVCWRARLLKLPLLLHTSSLLRLRSLIELQQNNLPSGFELLEEAKFHFAFTCSQTNPKLCTKCKPNPILANLPLVYLHCCIQTHEFPPLLEVQRVSDARLGTRLFACVGPGICLQDGSLYGHTYQLETYDVEVGE